MRDVRGGCSLALLCRWAMGPKARFAGVHGKAGAAFRRRAAGMQRYAQKRKPTQIA
ncbi:MAG: hypothetical protein N2110_10235 [Flavobacteriales bacterium]|nr:hypothetical protein [Flavobacteriales bacterium]